MRNRRTSGVLFLSVSVTVLSGCAAFRSGEAKPPEPWPVSTAAGRQSVSLIITGEAIVNDARQDVPQRAIDAWRGETERAYKESGLFSDVLLGAAETDLRAEIHVLDRGEGNMGLAMLSGLTLTLVPGNAYDEFTITTTFKDKEGRTLGTYEEAEGISFWMEFFLVFVMPFKSPNAVAKEVLYDLNRAVIEQARGAGLLAFNPVSAAYADWLALNAARAPRETPPRLRR